MHVIVDRQLCESNGICAEVAPHIFQLLDDDELVVLVEEPDESQRALVETSVRRCPRQAIRIEP